MVHHERFGLTRLDLESYIYTGVDLACTTMAAVDPTYPLYSLACLLASIGVLFVLLTSFVRQNWNLGVTFLCFWLCIENLSNGIDAVIWSDNADVKLYVYCDIVRSAPL